MKRADSPSSSAATGGGESSVTSGNASWSERAASTSRKAMKPISTRIFPSLSPRSFCSSRARSRSSGWIRRRVIRISPRRCARGSGDAGSRLGSCMVANLKLHRADGGLARGVRQQLLALSLHHDLGRKAAVVLPGVVEQRDRQHYLFAGRQVFQGSGGHHQHLAHFLFQHGEALDFAVVYAGDFNLSERLMKRTQVGADDQVQFGAEYRAVTFQIDAARGAQKIERIRCVGPGEMAVATFFYSGQRDARDSRVSGRRRLLSSEEKGQKEGQSVHRTSPVGLPASLLASIVAFWRFLSTSMYSSKRTFISCVSSAWRRSDAASNACVSRACRDSLWATAIETASLTRLETSVSSAARVIAGLGALACGAGRVSEKTNKATESMAAEANPKRAAELHSASHPRRKAEGSKTGSETKPMRWGISSSGNASRAISVPRIRSSSSRQCAQVLT